MRDSSLQPKASDSSEQEDEVAVKKKMKDHELINRGVNKTLRCMED